MEIVAVITGASEGIGRAMAIELAGRGAKLGLVARRRELLEAVAAECRAAGSPDARVAAVDVTDRAALRGALETLDRELGGTTHFVANAGISGRSDPARDMSDDLRRCFEVNVLAAVDGLEWMKERMVSRGRGTLCAISSVAATRGLPDSGAYSASKAAISTYLESLRVDLAPFGIRVVTIAPGYVATSLTKKNRGAMPFLTTAERAARVFVEGLLTGRRFVVAPWQYAWIIRVLRILPGAVFDAVVGRFMRRVRGPKAR
jgi:short-subunit dehydrogenase